MFPTDGILIPYFGRLKARLLSVAGARAPEHNVIQKYRPQPGRIRVDMGWPSALVKTKLQIRIETFQIRKRFSFLSIFFNWLVLCRFEWIAWIWCGDVANRHWNRSAAVVRQDRELPASSARMAVLNPRPKRSGMISFHKYQSCRDFKMARTLKFIQSNGNDGQIDHFLWYLCNDA